MATAVDLTPTSYAILGLLAIKPWTTYELAQQMDRTVSKFWPRARSKVYEEPKKLVDYGLARAAEDAVGQRRRTRYTITSKGRRALATWLAQPGEGPVLAYEQMLKVFLADSATTDDLRRTLHDMRVWAHEQTLLNADAGHAYLEGRAPFPQRAAINQLVGRFLDDMVDTIDRWAEWATDIINDWPDAPRDADANAAELAATVQRIDERAARRPTPNL